MKQACKIQKWIRIERQKTPGVASTETPNWGFTITIANPRVRTLDSRDLNQYAHSKRQEQAFAG